MADLPLMWRKSTRSGGNNGNCVEVALRATAGVLVRDSKNPDGPVLKFNPAAMDGFLSRLRRV